VPIFSKHPEAHFTSSATVRDIVIGMSDGLTVPFALAAGISGAIASSRIVVTAGIAEVAAGATAMALGDFLAARTDVEHYRSEETRERGEIQNIPAAERGEVRNILHTYGLAGNALSAATRAVSSLKSAIQTVLIGGIASAVAFWLAKLVQQL
jgi:VIT1/CCC1 family predicted Fe2+/Mn2+ transporter